LRLRTINLSASNDLEEVVNQGKRRLNQSLRRDAARHPTAALRVAIAGLGAIGLKVAEALDRGIPGCVLAAVSTQATSKFLDASRSSGDETSCASTRTVIVEVASASTSPQ
jgi:hypothetical protein